MLADLVESVAPRLAALSAGGYSRAHRGGTRIFRTQLQATLAAILDAMKVAYVRDRVIPGTEVKADFFARGTYFLLDRGLTERQARAVEHAGSECFSIIASPTLSDGQDTGLRVLKMGRLPAGRQQTIFLDDPSFTFDYAHILPHTEKCSVMHGHTSSALVEIVGETVDGMVVDFGPAKGVVREAIRELDHKLFINEKYVKARTGRNVVLRFRTVHGDFEISAPKATTVLLEGEATVENLANELLERVLPKMPANVSAVGVYVYEGLNKGAHLVAQLHSGGGGTRRRKP
jgi:6-pyruvoyl-tetrahydropterin synthase